MLHPFLILPIVGAMSLAKIAVDATYKGGDLFPILVIVGLIGIVCFCVWAYLNDDVKPYRPTRDNPAAMTALIDGIKNPPLFDIRGRMQRDNARVIFDIIEFGIGVAGPGRGPGGQVIIRNDMHNDVHNHQIQESLRESIRNLNKWYDTIPESERISKTETFKSVKEFLFSDYKDKLDRKEKAYSTIRHIEKTNGRLAAVDLTEGEILQRIWQRINDPINKEVCADLRNNLLDLLAESAIHIDAPYCLVGRVTRMVQSLQSIDKEGLVDIKTKEIIINEVQNKIPILRDEFFADHPALLTSYEQGNDVIARQLIDFVRDGLYKDYPQAKSDAELQKVIEEHLEELT